MSNIRERANTDQARRPPDPNIQARNLSHRPGCSTRRGCNGKNLSCQAFSNNLMTVDQASRPRMPRIKKARTPRSRWALPSFVLYKQARDAPVGKQGWAGLCARTVNPLVAFAYGHFLAGRLTVPCEV